MQQPDFVARVFRLGIMLAVMHGLVSSVFAANEQECQSIIDVTNFGALQACYLQRGWLHRQEVTWKNTGSSPVYICFGNSPFDAFAWQIPPQQQGKPGQRKSGKLRSDVTIGEYVYRPVTQLSDCSDQSRGDPRIIIK